MSHALTFLTLLSISPAFVSAAVAAEEWIELFNGRDLSGWQVLGENKSAWGVVDGNLQPIAEGQWISTDREYADFELELEYNMPAGGNSGLFFRAPHEGAPHLVGMEIQLIDDFTEAFGKLEPYQLTGSLYGVLPARPGAVKKAGEWQKLAIKVEGRQLAVTLNGTIVVECDLDSFADKEAEHPGLKRAKGFIGLQNYGGRPVLIRSVKLRELEQPPG